MRIGEKMHLVEVGVADKNLSQIENGMDGGKTHTHPKD